MDKIKKDIRQVRENINEIDYKIAELFEKRMKCAAELADDCGMPAAMQSGLRYPACSPLDPAAERKISERRRRTAHP